MATLLVRPSVPFSTHRPPCGPSWLARIDVDCLGFILPFSGRHVPSAMPPRVRNRPRRRTSGGSHVHFVTFSDYIIHVEIVPDTDEKFVFTRFYSEVRGGGGDELNKTDGRRRPPAERQNMGVAICSNSDHQYISQYQVWFQSHQLPNVALQGHASE